MHLMLFVESFQHTNAQCGNTDIFEVVMVELPRSDFVCNSLPVSRGFNTSLINEVAVVASSTRISSKVIKVESPPPIWLV